jgi:hypothetical protein
MRKTLLGPPVRTGNVQVFTRSRSDRGSEAAKIMKKDPGETTTPHTHPITWGGWVGGSPKVGELVKPTVDELLVLAKLLSKTEQKEFLSKLAAEQADTGKDRDLQAWIAEVLAALERSNGGHAGGLPTSAHLKRAMASGGWHAVSDFMQSAGFMKLQVNERVAAYRLLSNLLVQHAAELSRKKSIPRTPQLLANCAVNIGALFDNAFPGYLAAGLAPIVVRTMLKKVAP